MSDTTIPTIDTGVSQADRAQVAEGLARLLADTTVLYFKAHSYHWNVVGPSFPLLHDLFEQDYRELHGSIDVIAERIRALGHLAPGSLKELGALASVPEADGVPEAREMVVDLALGHEQLARTARELLPVADTAEDHPTVDLLTQRITAHEKASWMLRSTIA